MRFQDDFQSKGMQNVFADDIIKFIDVVNDDQDLQLLSQVLITCLKDHTRSVEYLPKWIGMFFGICHNLNNLEQAKAMWNEQAFVDSGLNNRRSIRLKYLVLLYKNKCFSEIFDECNPRIEAGSGNIADLDEGTLVMAALAETNTEEALIKAKNLMDILTQGRSRSPAGRMVYLNAWLAFSLGKHGNAYDLLCSRLSRGKALNSNFKVAILADIGRVEEAFEVIRSAVLFQHSGDVAPRIMSFEVMRKLADAVNESEDDKVKSNFTTLCADLDGQAKMVNETLKEMIFRPIDQRLKRLETRQRHSRSPSRNLDSHID